MLTIHTANLQVMSTVRDLGVVTRDWQSTDDGRPHHCRLSVRVLSLGIINYASCVVLCSRWRRRQPWRSFILLSAHVLITVIPCCTALQIISSSDYSPCRTLQHDWLPVHEDLSTPRQCCNHCTGCLLGSGLSTNLCCVLTTGVALDVILSGPANDSGQGWLCSTSVGILAELPHR